MPRYVDTYVKEEVPSLEVTMRELSEIDKEIGETNKKLLGMMEMLTSTDSSFYNAMNIFKVMVNK